MHFFYFVFCEALSHGELGYTTALGNNDFEKPSFSSSGSVCYYQSEMRSHSFQRQPFDFMCFHHSNELGSLDFWTIVMLILVCRHYWSDIQMLLNISMAMRLWRCIVSEVWSSLASWQPKRVAKTLLPQEQKSQGLWADKLEPCQQQNMFPKGFPIASLTNFNSYGGSHIGPYIATFDPCTYIYIYYIYI